MKLQQIIDLRHLLMGLIDNSNKMRLTDHPVIFCEDGLVCVIENVFTYEAIAIQTHQQIELEVV